MARSTGSGTRSGGLNWAVPSTDELPTPDGVGRFNHFSNAGSISWTPETGANVIYGAIRNQWEALGWERSYLGYPTTDVMDFAEGGRANEFQNGGIYWWPDTGPIDLRDVVVHYTGLHCFGETDWDQGSSADEPYVIVSVTTPRIADTKTTRVYSDVDGGDDRIGSGTTTLSARQMVLLAARTGNSNFNGIGFKAESPLISGSGASYKAYYGLVPA